MCLVNLKTIPFGINFRTKIQNFRLSVIAVCFFFFSLFGDYVPDTYIQTAEYVYSSNGRIFYAEVWGGFWVAFKGTWWLRD
jgi:hypothetical protein